jgi:type II secretion system protein N
MKKWVAVTGYVIVITLIFLYYLFPTEALTAYINYRLLTFLPQCNLTIKQIRPGFPPGLKFETLMMYRQGKEFIGMDQLTIRPRYLTMFSQTKSFVLYSVLNGGRIDGTAGITFDKSLLSVDLSLDHVNIGGIPALKEIIPHSISGAASGKIVYANQPPFGNGKVDIGLSNCLVDFKPAFFGMNQLKMDSITARAELADQLLKIETIEVTGREVNGKASGTMTIRNPIVQSALNISGQVTPTPALMKSLADIIPVSAMIESNASSSTIPFKISGTVESPAFSSR